MTVSEWGGDSGTRVPGADVIASESAAVDSERSAPESGNDDSGNLRAAALKLARLLDPIAFDDRAKPQNLGQRFDQYARQQTAMDHATIALIRGYRLVSEDDTTVAGMVREFHVAFNLPINDATRTLNKLRADLIREEAEETAEAVESGDREHMAKELADLAYVVYGAALTLGIDLDVAVAAVHASNMSKLVDGKPVMRGDGKVLKGPNYRPPDMSAAVRALREAGQ